MPKFNSYQRISAVKGDEVLVVADAAGSTTFSATAGQIAGSAAVSQNSGQFYEDAGSVISRHADRVLIGAASDNLALASRSATSTDWLSGVMAASTVGAWPMWGAQFASLARYGSLGVLGGSRTSDASASAGLLGYTPSSIGVGSWAVSDVTSPTSTETGYAFYGEAWRMEGADNQPCFGMELEAVNFGAASTAVCNPYHPNVGGGVVGVQLGSGGGQTSGTSDAACAVTVVSNPSAWQTGIVFGATALTGTNGQDAGYGSAISLARNHAVEWHTPETVDGTAGLNVGCYVRSTVTERVSGCSVQFADGEIAFGNIDGESVFSVNTIASPDNFLSVKAGSGEQAAGLYAQTSGSGNGNLGLYPAQGCEIQATSPVSGVGDALPTTVAGGFLHININGTDYRVPLFTVEQVGA